MVLLYLLGDMFGFHPGVPRLAVSEIGPYYGSPR
jgi:hypothetical protein